MIRLNNNFWIDYQHYINKENRYQEKKLKQEFLEIIFNTSSSNKLEIGNIK